MNLLTLDITAESVLQSLWRASWQAMVLAGLVLLIQWLLGSRIGGRGRYLLWSVVILRLMLPALPQSPLSLYNLARSAAEVHPSDPILPDSPVLEGPIVPADLTDAPSVMDQTPALQPRRWTAAQSLLIIWIAGLVAVIGRLIQSWLAWKRSIGRLEPITGDDVQHAVTAAARSLGMTKSPPVLAGPGVPTPAVVGLLRPRLILPARVLSHCTADEVRLILLHELAHVKRRDIAANWLLAAACILHWFNPLVWLTAARIRADRELACDETVLAASSGTDPKAYGQTLLRLIEILSPAPAMPGPQLVGILESPSPMQRRIRMIARYTPQSSSCWIWVGLVLLVLGCTSLTDSVRGQAGGANPTPARPATQPSARTDSQAKGDIQMQLQRNIPEARFEDISFDIVIGFLRDVSGINITVNWRALEAIGVDPKTPVSIMLRDVPFEQVLQHVLRNVAGGALGYMTEGQILTITSAEDAASLVTTVFYDVADLAGETPGDQALQQLDRLTQVIEDTIARESWRNNGGSVGAIASFRGKLIITQTPENQRKITQFLERLREAPSTRPRPLSE